MESLYFGEMNGKPYAVVNDHLLPIQLQDSGLYKDQLECVKCLKKENGVKIFHYLYSNYDANFSNKVEELASAGFIVVSLEEGEDTFDNYYVELCRPMCEIRAEDLGNIFLPKLKLEGIN